MYNALNRFWFTAILVWSALVLMGCGVQDFAQTNCPSGDVCRALVGGNRLADTKQDLVGTEQELQAQISSLKLQLDMNIYNLQTLSTNQSFDEALLAALKQTVLNQQVSITTLFARNSVVALIDFCGPAAGYNEVGMRMADGSTVAYFESGSTRFLTVLKPSSSYNTSDGTGCTFTTNAAGLVCDNLGCR